MSCPWVSNREIKCAEKTSKYAPLRYELGRRYPGYKTEQHNNNRRARRELAKCQGKFYFQCYWVISQRMPVQTARL